MQNVKYLCNDFLGIFAKNIYLCARETRHVLIYIKLYRRWQATQRILEEFVMPGMRIFIPLDCPSLQK